MRRWTSGLLACTIAVAILLLSFSFRSEPLRAVGALMAGGSICYAWFTLRPRVQSRPGLVLLSVALLTLILACTWSGLNVVRYYLYDPAIEGPAIYSTSYKIVCTTQVVVQWCGVIASLFLVVVLAISPSGCVPNLSIKEVIRESGLNTWLLFWQALGSK